MFYIPKYHSFKTWSLCSGRSLIHEPSPSQSLLLFFCFLATFNPCCLQIRSNLLWFTLNPSLLNMAVILDMPYLPYCAARSIMALVKLSSSGSFLILYLWVDLFCEIARQARLWEMPYLIAAATTAYLRLTLAYKFPLSHILKYCIIPRPDQQQAF